MMLSNRAGKAEVDHQTISDQLFPFPLANIKNFGFTSGPSSSGYDVDSLRQPTSDSRQCCRRMNKWLGERSLVRHRNTYMQMWQLDGRHFSIDNNCLVVKIF